jgi:hypothetical protein
MTPHGGIGFGLNVRGQKEHWGGKNHIYSL